MNSYSFFENFSLLAETPNGIPKLREMILQMAVQGKLAPQNPDDGPAEVLSERLHHKKLQRKMTEHDLDDVFFMRHIPENWLICSLDEILDVQNGHAFKSSLFSESEDGVPLIRIRDLNQKQTTVRYTGEYDDEYLVYPGDYLIGMDGKFEIHKWQGQVALLNQRVCRLINLSDDIEPDYILYILQDKLDRIHSSTSYVTVKHLSSKKIKSISIPLPPLEEQKRIVTKVDQLMELCDQLESLQQKKHENRVNLNNAALNKMLDAGSPGEFAENWRLVCDNFGLLYDNLENVEKLRQAILQLAVMGKLVEQDDEDEPAEVLLEKIRDEKERLVKEKKIKKSKVSPIVEGHEIPYQVPNNWRWTRADVLSEIIEYGTSHKASTNDSDVPVLRMNNINQGKISYDNLKYVPNEIKDLPRLFLKNNDLLFNRTNSYELVGKTGIFKGNDKEYTFASYLIRMSLLYDYVNPDFVNNAMNAEYFRKTQIEPEITQQCGQANFNGTKLKHSLIPLPPLAEQKRIVAKVDQLMELCDRLESDIRQAQEDGERLMEAVVNGLLT
ncbi:restriction endonuclease subunit S [Methanolobus sp. WCC1]|uniref:restriction endonuclease subunit S n=1 Tax=unclassified Methanolobus TaxID=2629569 RepID=UPI00324DE3DC